MKLNLGSGNRKLKGWFNVDIDPTSKPDKIMDVNKEFPFKDNSVDQVRASHLIEHVDDVFLFMYEIWRVCKKGAKIEIIAPNFSYTYWSIQPQHKRFIRLKYFEQWDPNYFGVENYSFLTKGAKFITKNEGAFNEDRELGFILEVIK